MKCSKCGYREMYRDFDEKSGIAVHVCYRCGNRAYNEYPRAGDRGVRFIDWNATKENCGG